MRIEIRPFGCGLVLAMAFLGFGTVAIIAGIDATIHRRTATGDSRFNLGRAGRSGGTYDRTWMYGPGTFVGGLSVALAGMLVIPSLWMVERNRRGRVSPHWRRVVFLWRLVIAGIVLGFGCAIFAAIIAPFF